MRAVYFIDRAYMRGNISIFLWIILLISAALVKQTFGSSEESSSEEDNNEEPGDVSSPPLSPETTSELQTTTSTTSLQHTETTSLRQQLQTNSPSDSRARQSTTETNMECTHCCRNRRVRGLFSQLSREESLQILERLKEETRKKLTVNKTTLSSYVRKKTSAPDDRPSATGIGYVGVAIIGVIAATLVTCDLLSIGRYLSYF